MKFVLENEEIIPEDELLQVRMERGTGKFIDFSPIFYTCFDCGESYYNKRRICPTCGSWQVVVE